VVVVTAMKRFGILCLALAALLSCASQKNYVTVQSKTSVAFFTGNVIILPADRSAKMDDAAFARVSSALAEVLTEKGYRIVAELNEADIIANVAFGIAENSVPHSVLGSDDLSQQIQGNPADIRTRNRQTARASYDGINEDRRGERTRYLTISAYRKSTETTIGNPPEIWTTTVTSQGYGSDLKTLIPRMIDSAASYIGTDRKGKLEVGRLD